MEVEDIPKYKTREPQIMETNKDHIVCTWTNRALPNEKLENSIFFSAQRSPNCNAMPVDRM